MTRASILSLIVTAVFCADIACAKKVAQTPPPAPPPATVVEAPPPPPPLPPPAPPAQSAPPTEDELFARKSVDDLNRERPLATVYFDLDQSSLGSDAREALQRNAGWLRRWPTTRITVEGHCDERGTPEYNLALGERRAAAVRDYLTSLGIADDRILVVSRGKETPQCTIAEESCWQQNRRGAPVITAK
ncbi:MAG: peptidoglycan-associated lipoprotein Pal [Vicinamibacterales bacterium]